MSKEQNNKNRRKVLLGITGVAGASQVPGQWSKPAIESVMLPAHASTTASGGDETGGTVESFNYSLLNDIGIASIHSETEREGILAKAIAMAAPAAYASEVYMTTTPSPTTPAPTTPRPTTTRRIIIEPRDEGLDWNVAVTGDQFTITQRSFNKRVVRRVTTTETADFVLMPVVDRCPGSGQSDDFVRVVAYNEGTNVVVETMRGRSEPGIKGGGRNAISVIPLGPVRSFSPDNCAPN
ncbi:MAG: hypothetical protein AAF402_00750 [Pseudomonadota bacterium]